MANIDNMREALAKFFYARLLMRLFPPFVLPGFKLSLLKLLIRKFFS